VIGELFMKDLRCPLLGVKRTWCGPNAMPAFDAKIETASALYLKVAFQEGVLLNK
jgi:hypothetical protein